MALRKIALILIVSGIALLFYSAAVGEASVALFLIFPVIYGSGVYSALGILLLMFGIFILFISPIEYVRDYEIHQEPNYELSEPITEKKTRYGGVIFIGPIPIVFGSDKGIAKISLMIGAVMLVAFAIFYFIHIYG